MTVFRLSPVDRDHPSWATSTHKDACEIRAESQEAARALAHERFGTAASDPARSPRHPLGRTSTWSAPRSWRNLGNGRTSLPRSWCRSATASLRRTREYGEQLLPASAVGSPFERLHLGLRVHLRGHHIPLHKWLQAIHLMCSSKQATSTHQLHHALGIGLNADGFLSHSIREAMRSVTCPRWAVLAP